MKKKLWLVLAFLLAAICLAGCTSEPDIESNYVQEAYEEGVLDGVDEEGDFVEEAIPHTGGEDWAIYIYMCGTDLESEIGMATANISELMEVTDANPDVNVYMQTGGTYEWQNPFVDPEVMQRFHVDTQNQQLTLLDEGELASMGDESTLVDFLDWATQHNTADKMGVLFWNHGGGPIDGLESDEIFGNALSIGNLRNAFDESNPEGEPFLEFVGFDTCLMANIEVADILSDHARYLIASEEIEPGGGWDYDSWYAYLCENPDATGAELGTVICDSYYQKCEQDGRADMATLSVVDLAVADELIEEFSNVAASMADVSMVDATANAEIIRGVQATERYGGDTASEGYTNLVDVGDMVYNIAEQLPDGGQGFLSAMEQAVVYNVCGPYRAYSTGLSIYYPMILNTEDEDSLQAIYDYVSAFGVDEYGMYICDLWGLPYGDFAPAGETEEDTPIEDPQPPVVGGMEVVISEEATVDEDGMYHMTIDPATLDNVKEVSFSLYADFDNDIFCYLGSDNNLYVDWETGYVEDNFQGMWPTIDNQYVTFDLVQSTAEYIIYSVPILLNGESTNLRVVWEWEDPEDPNNYNGQYVIWGAWDGIDSETGMPSRDIKEIVDGDEVIPILYCFDMNDPDNMFEVEGMPIIVDGGLLLEEYELQPGDYWYNFGVEDLMGGYTYSDFAVITIDEAGDMYIAET
ncbi:clostripain-related cysteine peptidase [Christensenellaceae bacterium OttesenSCG-928-K19]|nr:clostripain-related cysteine peptidase [Christensenellaceae bacterium OttesenSCG-928-K19]